MPLRFPQHSVYAEVSLLTSVEANSPLPPYSDTVSIETHFGYPLCVRLDVR